VSRFQLEIEVGTSTHDCAKWRVAVEPGREGAEGPETKNVGWSVMVVKRWKKTCLQGAFVAKSKCLAATYRKVEETVGKAGSLTWHQGCTHTCTIQ
jgi:hypothetical protein